MISALVLAFAALAALTIFLAWAFLLPPSDFPKNIPTIPFYYTLIPLCRDVDQATLYREYLEEPLRKYGAVKIFFGARWNILVQRPKYVAEVFKYEDIYAKSGNQKKIPYSVLAEYTGTNIISAHGADWRLFRSVIQPGLQADFKPEPILKNAQLLLQLILEENSKKQSVVVPPLFQRFTLATLSEGLLGTSFQTLQSQNAPLHRLQLGVKREIFKPLFLNFPFLDLFNVPSRQRARILVRDFTTELCNTVLQSHQHNCHEKTNESLGCRMVDAYRTGILTEKQFRHNMISVFLAGHENPQLLLVSTIFLLGEHPQAQARLRREILQAEGSGTPLQDVPYFTSILYEVLRMYPPISQLINRKTTEAVVLGGNIAIPKDTYLGYNAYSTGRDKVFWGEDADDFKPERWGTTNDEINSLYRNANSKAGFIAFHGGRRACLGQKFALFEGRLTLALLLKNLRWTIDPTWRRRMTPAGPLYPMLLRVKFEELETVAIGSKA
ncbi:cytochrome P450 [Phyllosticta citribraziliensis]|uniref:Cytochrome P450 n=1 Tax=Phyllosticta citribraziliensis TaxID=989973 RepID=A0ABR1LTG1_9PEZI